jgi:hypothetical protein
MPQAMDREPWHVDRCLALVVGRPQDAVVQRGVAVAYREQKRVSGSGRLLVSQSPQGRE